MTVCPPVSSGGKRKKNFQKETRMVDLTKMNGKQITVNAEMIETIEETPDTVLTLTGGKKIIVKESRQEVKNLVILYKREICNGIMSS